MRKKGVQMFLLILLIALLVPGRVFAEEEDGAAKETEETAQKEDAGTGEKAAGEQEKKPAAGSFEAGSVIADGVYIGPVDVGGMTAEEALEAVQKEVDAAGKKTLTLTLEGADGVEPLLITAAELGLRTEDLSELVTKAMALGKSGNLIARYKAEKDLQVSNQVYELGMAVDEGKVRRFVEEKTSGLAVEPVNAELTRTEDGFSVSESRAGIQVDETATVSAVMEAFKDWDREDFSLAAAAEITQPEHTTEQLSQIQDSLGSFSTSNGDRSSGKLQNVQRGVDLTNDILIMPGESWSMHDSLAPFTAENGYTKQVAYQGTAYVQEYGGGICQLATTLYNAALRAEVTVSERFNHSMIVGYTIWGLDATINDDGSKDLVLTNDFDFPIYIEAVHSGGGRVTYTIWGKETRPAGRTLEFTNAILSEEYLPDEVTLNPNMPQGTEDVTQKPYPRAVVTAYKNIYLDGVRQETIELHTDHYKGRAKKVVRGSAVPVDPNAGLPAGTDPGAQPETPAPAPETPPAENPAPVETPPPAETPPQTPAEVPAPAEG